MAAADTDGQSEIVVGAGPPPKRSAQRASSPRILPHPAHREIGANS